ncbi:NTP transferase domain-containing protein [uncultured Anaerovibrio sp.]|uniref:NTP transferase domain-containing protein n=1 Tax=uncultured Anaerovibrio sp. TaxID=361586 RepID=UPI0025D67D00|nr:NTP transferase domain-containing protein [uncultured Anaerovibrio sp.]
MNGNKLYNRLNKQEADILYELYKEPFVNQRILSEVSRHSLGVVNRSLKSLIKKEYLDEHVQLTEKASALFKARTPNNAIILAAGFGMRMVPINLSIPKALIEVNGEVLIERIIGHLHEVGVTDITVIVGFMKENFEYLIDEYGVKLFYTTEYASKNNIHSLSVAVDRIENTYIVPCDIWCDRNPFRRHELYSWYMVSDLVDETSEVRVNRKMELVKISEHSAGNGMIGISYLTGDEAETVKCQVRNFVNNKKYDNKFWEEALYVGDRMIVQARVVHSADVVEINTYEQLRELDSDSNHLKSDAIHTICKVMDCRSEDIVDIEVLKKGMTNRSFLFRISGGARAGKYIMRIPGEGTDKLINRHHEVAVFKAINGHGICDNPVYINQENGYKITKYLKNIRTCNILSEIDIKKCMAKLRKFHLMRLTVGHTFDLFEQIEFYEHLWGNTSSVYRDYKRTKENVLSLKSIIDKSYKDCCLTHIDAVADNFLFCTDQDGNEEVQLVDWEYSGMQDPHVDIAMFGIYAKYDKTQMDNLIDIYFENQCDPRTRLKIYCYISVCGLLWSNWCEYKRNLGVEFGDYSLYQYRYAKEYFHYANQLL